MQELKNSVKLLVEEELISANKKFPMFQSPHEGYAVIKEEIEEAEQELIDVTAILKRIWYFIKRDENVNKDMFLLKEYAIKLAAESIQVAAMAQKFLESSNKW